MRNLNNITNLKILLDKFVQDGGNVNNLTQDDVLYKKVKYISICDEQGNPLGIAEKFAYLGHPEKTKRKSFTIEELKKSLDDYVKNGGIVDDLTKKHPIYEPIHKIKIYDTNKKLLTLEEKFTYLEHPRKSKVKKYTIPILQSMLDDYVKSGGIVDDLTTQHPIYKILVDYDMYDKNERLMSLEEKFAFLGHPRKAKNSNFETYSKRLSELNSFKDDNGYVDSYKQDTQMDNFIKTCSEQFKIPLSLVVCLLGNQKLKKHVVEVDRYEYLKTLLSAYVQKYGNFVDLRSKDPYLYELLSSSSRDHHTSDGSKISIYYFIDFLGFGHIENRFLKLTNATNFSEQDFIDKYGPISRNNNGQLSFSDIDSSDYTALTHYLRRTNQTTDDFFNKHNITYTNARAYKRNHNVFLDFYPFLQDMKDEVDLMLFDYFSANLDMQKISDGEFLKIKLCFTQMVYEKYKPLIQEKFVLDSELIYPNASNPTHIEFEKE